MCHPLRAFLIALVLGSALRAEESDVAGSLPEDIPGGRDLAAQSLKSGVPQLVKKTIEDLVFAQEEPAFAPWRVALEGKASKMIVEDWVQYVTDLQVLDVEAKAFREQATAWFEGQTEMSVEDSARLSAGLRWPSEILAKRHLEAARAGNTFALLALAGNSKGHPALLALCNASEQASDNIPALLAASQAQSIVFRPLFNKRIGDASQEIRFLALNGLLRLGDPADLKLASDYFATPGTYRHFDVYLALSNVKSKEAVDQLFAEQAHAIGPNRQGVVIALGHEKDERILPKLRELRDVEGYTRGVCNALWHQGRAGDIPWLFSKIDDVESGAVLTLRKLLGKGCPIEFPERVPGVKKWIDEHKVAIEKDVELPLK